ncbi:phage holin family protein [Anaerorhabdus furcosa]|uniref:Putative membrane protein n=1 Tax=Anaerorhabdus furcosa TaxID=118967 RepID=A0A1T4MK52_9FIRM|nr:phage holin family protein [Anaerorhabdus furcosa]SJZ67134.1 putative membrane protein [Anaerorhabdus furcosa]
MKRIILTLAVNTISLWIVNYLFTGVEISSGETLMILAIILSLLNVTIKPILNIFTFPVTLLTFGLFSLIINGFVLQLAFSFVSGASIDSFTTTVLAAIVLSIANSFLNALVGKK